MFAPTMLIFLNYQNDIDWGFADDCGDWKWSFGIVSPHLFLFPPSTRKRDTLHRYWDLSLFLLTEKMKTARLTLKGALKSKSVDQGSFWMKTVKQKSHNTWKEIKAFKDFQRFYSNGNAIILGPLSHHPDNVLYLKLKLYFVIVQFLFHNFKICQFSPHFMFPFLYSSFLASSSRCMNCEVVFQWGLELQ